MPLASTSMTQRSEELGFSLMNSDSANRNGIAGDCHHHNDTPIPLSVISESPLPDWNMNETSQCYSNEIEPTGSNSMIDSSQFKSAQNFQMDRHYLCEGDERKPLVCRPDSGFPCPEGYVGQLYQNTRHDNLTIPDDVMNTAFNLNSFEKHHGGGKCVTPGDISAGGPQMVNRSGMEMNGNIGQPLLSMNFGTPLFDERSMTFGSGSNKESKSDTNMSRINITGNSERIFPPPINTYHNQVDSRSFLNPGLDMNPAFSGFQNYNEFISDLAHTGDRQVLFDSRPGLHLGPSYAFQRPAAGDQNHYLRPVSTDLGHGGMKDTGMEFAVVGHKNSFDRCMALASLPFVGSQTSGASGQFVPSSIGMITDQSPSELLPENNGKFSSQSFTSPPVVVATGSTSGQDPSNNHGQSQVVGSIQQSNSPLGPLSTSGLGIQTGKGNLTAQVSRPSVISSLKRAASRPSSSSVQVQRRKTRPTQPLIHPSIPTPTRLAPSVPNAPQTIPPLIHTAESLTPQAAFVPPMFPATWTKSALSAANITPTIPPLMQTAPFLPPQACATVSLPPHDKRTSSLLRSSCTPPVPNPQIAQSLAHQRLRVPIIPSAANNAPRYIKYKDQIPEPIGYKCLLCKRDLSYAPEGPFSQPSAPPAAAVLPCGHTFHEQCLQRITPDDQSKDPPCIPCALGE